MTQLMGLLREESMASREAGEVAADQQAASSALRATRSYRRPAMARIAFVLAVVSQPAGAFPASGRDNQYAEPRPSIDDPTLAPTSAAEEYCRSVIATTDTADLLKESYASVEDAYDSDAFGHATYHCAEILVDELAQYDKAEYYLWCVVGHCEDCSAGSCETSRVGLDSRDECRSATLNYLGFVNRKKAVPDYDHAEDYYLEALDLWPQNCGALEYLAELYETTGNATAAAALAPSLDACGLESADAALALAPRWLGRAALGAAAFLLHR